MSSSATTRFAIVALAGRPNAGKSTLLNRIVGENLAITSPKPQSTRHVVRGILTEGDTQLVFVDPPGLFDPRNLMQESMVDSAARELRDADIVLHLHPADAGDLEPLVQMAPSLLAANKALATVLTKIDLLAADRRPLLANELVFPISAVTGEGIEQLLQWCREGAQMGPFLYALDDLSTQDLRFFAAEAVREAAFELLEQELPYATAARVDEFREGTSPVYIRVTLYVERASQKGMLIGKGGATVKALGERARIKIEKLLGDSVYLDLWVKVLNKWRKSPRALRMLGHPVHSRQTRRGADDPASRST
jgi:GTP-binding protein Era